MKIKQIIDAEIKFMLKLNAIRNNSTFEKQCLSYEEWTMLATKLLDDGFMVHIEGAMFSILDSKGEVKFVQDKDIVKYIGV